MKKIILITSFAMIFSAIEITGGLLSGSVAILADATDGLCDILGYWIQVFAICAANNKKLAKTGSSQRTFGLSRIEVLGALCSVLIVWVLLVLLLIEATRRLINIANDDVNAEIMLITSSIGIGFNVTNIFLLEFCFNPPKKQIVEDEEN